MDSMADPIPAAPVFSPRLVVSDIDGTFLTSAERVTPRLLDAVLRAERAGCTLALATGRPCRWVYPVLEQLPIRPLCVTANGAVLYDSAEDRVLHSHVMQPDTMAAVVAAAREALEDSGKPGAISVAVERAGSSSLDPEDEIFFVTPEYEHAWTAPGFAVRDEEEVLAEPAVKLLLRNDALSAPELHEVVSTLVSPELAHVTYSMGFGLLEVAAPGVNKALGVAELARRAGVAQEETACFGDMLNDVEMIHWAGVGVAMGNASAEVKDAADLVTGTNNDDGVAAMLDQWFAPDQAARRA